jgi:hypothetical protein
MANDEKALEPRSCGGPPATQRHARAPKESTTLPTIVLPSALTPRASVLLPGPGMDWMPLDDVHLKPTPPPG